MDLYYLGDALRSLGYIPTLAVVEKLGGTKTKGEGFLNIDEFLPIVDQVSNLKDMGNLEVFVECLRLYDNHENGLMKNFDLQSILTDKGNYKSYHLIFFQLKAVHISTLKSLLVTHLTLNKLEF